MLSFTHLKVVLLENAALRQFGALILLLVTCMAPAMACMVPGAEMSTQERACCRTMKNQCGQMGMPASHGCCQKAPPSVHDNALARRQWPYPLLRSLRSG